MGATLEEYSAGAAEGDVDVEASGVRPALEDDGSGAEPAGPMLEEEARGGVGEASEAQPAAISPNATASTSERFMMAPSASGGRSLPAQGNRGGHVG